MLLSFSKMQKQPPAVALSKAFLNIVQNSQRNTSDRVSFLSKLRNWVLQLESWSKGWRQIHEIKQNRLFYGLFYSWFFAIFYRKTSKFGLRVDGWVLAIKSKHFSDFLKSFGNSRDNLYIHFLVIIILFRFTCGEEKLC